MHPELLTALRACLALGMLSPHRETLHLRIQFPPRPEELTARRAVLAALLRAYGPMALYLADGGGRAIPVDTTTDLAHLEETELHVGAWLLLASRHADARAALDADGRDPFRTPVLAELCARGELDAAVASYWDDREWLVAARPRDAT